MKKFITFIELSGFSKRRTDLINDDSFRELQTALIINPELGDLIIGTGGFRKLRWSREGMGKRGGVRIIYYNLSQRSGRLYLAMIYSKNEAENLTAQQKQMLKHVAEQLK